jgi:hypothetical protein
MFWLFYSCLYVVVWGHVVSQTPPKYFPCICIINICFSWQMSKLLLKKEWDRDTKNCHHNAMWKAAARHFASNKWNSKGILDLNERPWRHMVQNCIKTNLTKAPFNLLPGDRVIVLSRTNIGGLWWDQWRQEHWHNISDSIQNLLIIQTGIKLNAQGWASMLVTFP